MRVVVKSLPVKLVLIAIESAAFALLTVWVGKAYFADVVSRRLDAEDLTLATRLDPGESDYHLKLGRIYQYSLSDIDPSRAIAELTRAAQLSPMDAQPWLDLGAAQVVAGQIDQATISLRQADYLAPNLPGFQWAIANFFLLHGNTSEAMSHFKAVLAGTRRYDGVIFTTAWKAVGDGDQILAALIPDRPETEFSYLYFLIGQNKAPEARKVWERIASSSSSFDPRASAVYMDWLMGAHQPDEAYSVWNDLRKRKLLTESAAPGNLVLNGDFEQGIENFGFGWRIDGFYPGVYVSQDSTIFHSSGHSVMIAFTGKGNLAYQGFHQWIKVTPGVAYHASVYMKTAGITTDSGPRLQVFDTLNPPALNAFSDQLTGTNAGWTLLTLDFKPKEEHYVTVCITRGPSGKLDNNISGKVWVDDVSIAPVGSQ
jgi:tetratricopeptide (TPR) repeat protein